MRKCYIFKDNLFSDFRRFLMSYFLRFLQKSTGDLHLIETSVFRNVLTFILFENQEMSFLVKILSMLSSNMQIIINDIKHNA